MARAWLKRLLAEVMLDAAVLRDVAAKNGDARGAPRGGVACLNETLFWSLDHARSGLRAWRDDYNHVRPHGALKGLTPAQAAELAHATTNDHTSNSGLQP